MKLILALTLIALVSSTTKDTLEEKSFENEETYEPILEGFIDTLIRGGVRIGKFLWKHRKTIGKAVDTIHKGVETATNAHEFYQKLKKEKEKRRNLRKKK